MQPRLIASECGYNFVWFGKIFALPHSLGPTDLESADVASLPGVMIGEDFYRLRNAVRWRSIAQAPATPMTSMLNIPANVELFGGNHPALAPLFEGTYEGCIAPNHATGFSGTSANLAALDQALQGFRARMTQAGVPATAAQSFIERRDYVSQCIVSAEPGIHFFQGTPLTLGQAPWCVQVEKGTSLFLPFVTAAASWSFDPMGKDAGIYNIVKTLLGADECLGIITNIKETADTLPRLFADDRLKEKIHHLPFFMPAPPVRGPKKTGRFLFTTSWHQHDRSFYSRGGVDAAMIFAALSKRHDNLELIVRCRLPDDLHPEIRAILALPNVSIIDGKIDDAEMAQLFAEAEYYLLPATSLHSMSTLEAMANGCICILADSWGSDEYLLHGVNGLRISGREGKNWRKDSERGIVYESYAGLETPDPEFVARAVTAVEDVLNDSEKRLELSEAARAWAARNHSPDVVRARFAEIVRAMKERAQRMHHS